MKQIFLFIIRFYQNAISPCKPACCRFYPTCSSYALEAISRFGAWKGGLLALWRLLRCGPWNRGGYDPVPPRFTFCRKRSAGACQAEAPSSMETTCAEEESADE